MAKSKPGANLLTAVKMQIKDQTEIEIQRSIIKLLKRHPAIGWARRMNVGGTFRNGRWIEFAFAGCSDIIGQLRTGEFFACEVKRPGQVASEMQASFITDVNQNRGLAMVASSVEDVTGSLNKWVKQHFHTSV